ncbi:MAG: glycosyltransferase, partial [Leptospiraceae bacterium]|nr:glycosyltransferase [Leptospiraceae bacterium]
MPYLDAAELPTLYSAADLFILPSLIEGFGFPIIEAMASGTPVMASAASSLPEIGADAARYFDPRDTDDFLRVLNEVLGSEELREKMVRTGLQRARDFEWKQHAEDLIKLYTEFAGKVRLENELND